MKEQNLINYHRVADAIAYIHKHYHLQPTLEEIAEKVHLSPFHFQRLFTNWAGVSPKKFLQYISVEHAKEILTQSQATLFDTAHEMGLSSTSRLHDLFVKIEGMTPGEYKNKGKNLTINYSYKNSLFGELLIASTSKGICFMGFSDNRSTAFSELKNRFPNATYNNTSDDIQESALQMHTHNWNKINCVKLHLKASDFQLKVWEALLKIPKGNLATYGAIAQEINNPNASRAVGTAIGQNPIAFLIPCHRVIKATGVFGGYMWGTTRKTAIIGWEASKMDTLDTTP